MQAALKAPLLSRQRMYLTASTFLFMGMGLHYVLALVTP